MFFVGVNLQASFCCKLWLEALQFKILLDRGVVFPLSRYAKQAMHIGDTQGMTATACQLAGLRIKKALSLKCIYIFILKQVNYAFRKDMIRREKKNEKKLGLYLAGIIGVIIATTTIVLGATTSPQAIAATTTTEHFQQGVVTSSSDPLPGHSAHQAAMILPPRQDGQIYSGILTFTASKKVEIVVIHAIPTQQFDIFNSTIYGAILSAQLNNSSTTAAISLITPNYGNTPAASYSIPFTGSALALHTLSGEPFAAAYSVSYSLGTAELNPTQPHR
jgi:hypothetical protein